MSGNCTNCGRPVSGSDVTCPFCGELMTRRISSDLQLDLTGEVLVHPRRDPALDDSGGALQKPRIVIAAPAVEAAESEPELEILSPEEIFPLEEEEEPEAVQAPDAAATKPLDREQPVLPRSAPETVPARTAPEQSTAAPAREERLFPPPLQAFQQAPEKGPDPTPSPSTSPTAARRTQILAETDHQGILHKCGFLAESGYNMIGLFGRPETGKSCFLYALREHFKRGTAGFGGFTSETEAWDDLARDLEKQWNSGRYVGTARGLYFFQARSPKKKNHICILDIAGEHFENVKTWSGEVFDFFGLYLARCKGFFILVELDESIANHTGYGAAERRSRQMEQIIAFLSVAASVDRVASVADLESKRKAVSEAGRRDGKSKLRVPVTLCLSKADRIPSMNFGPVYGRIVPGDGSPLGDPWFVVKTFWGEHYQSLLNLVPHLRIEWLSCLGADFERQRRFTGSMGLRAAFDHVVVNPPPRWAMSAKSMLKYRKWLRF